MDLLCWNCRESLADIPLPISRHANCPKCFEVLHCCRFCRFYAPGRPGNCEEDRADPPSDKGMANFCEYFSPRSRRSSETRTVRRVGAHSQLSALFGEGEEADASDDDDDPVKRKLDSLFDD